MDYIIEQIQKMLNSLPASDNKQEVERNLIDMAEDKYLALIDNGIDEEEAHRLVVDSVCSLEDISEALGISKKEIEYQENKIEKSKQLSKFIILIFILPIAFILINDIFNNDLVSNIAFPIVVLGILYAFAKILTLILELEKSKKIMENNFSKKMKLLRNIIILLVFFAFVICVILETPAYSVIISIGVGFGFYYVVKYFLQKNI